MMSLSEPMTDEELAAIEARADTETDFGAFIAHARIDVELLLQEIRALKNHVANLELSLKHAREG